MLRVLLVLILLVQSLTWGALPEITVARQYGGIVLWPGQAAIGLRVQVFVLSRGG